MARVLVAEDDQSLLQLSVELLASSAEVDAASHTAPALRLIAAHDYDLLLTDLNIDRGGDGLILAGAMRALHPSARNVLMSGFPDFTRALAALQAELDQILTKPVATATLRTMAEPGAWSRAHPPTGPKLSLCALLARQQQKILADWLRLVEADPHLGSVALSPVKRVDHMTMLLEGLVLHREDVERAGAVRHGQVREAEYPAPTWVSLEFSYLRRALLDAVLRELLEIDLSRFPQEMLDLNLRLDADLLESLHAYGLQRG